MSTASYLRTPTVQRLPEILNELKSGTLRIPPFQRDFEWKGSQRLLLLDSVRNGLPTGSLMVWRTSQTLRPETVLGPFRLDLPVEAPMSHQYLLDGRQRMTTLFAALGAGLWTSEEQPYRIASTEAPDGTPWAAGFDLDRAEFVHLDSSSEVEIDSEDDDGKAPILPLAILLDDTAYDEWRASTDLTREQTRTARDLRSAFVDYLIPVVPLATDTLDVVTRTFKRINSAGTTMGDLHMARALAWSEEFDLIAEIEAIQEQLASIGWREVDADVVLKVVAAAANLDPTSFDVEKLATALISAGSERRAEMMIEATLALKWAIFVLARLGMLGPGLLPAVYALVLPAAALMKTFQAETDERIQALADTVVRPWLAERLLAERFGNAPAHTLRAMQKHLEAQLGVPGTGPQRKRAKLKPKECVKFNLQWARSRVVATVLALQRPLRPDGSVLKGTRLLADRGSDAIAQLLLAGAPGIAPRESAMIRARPNLATALLHPANRVIAEPDDLPELRRLLLYGKPSVELLQSHLIDPAGLGELQIGDFTRFFERRRDAILRAEEAWAGKMGVEFPSVARGPRKLWL